MRYPTPDHIPAINEPAEADCERALAYGYDGLFTEARIYSRAAKDRLKATYVDNDGDSLVFAMQWAAVAQVAGFVNIKQGVENADLDAVDAAADTLELSMARTTPYVCGTESPIVPGVYEALSREAVHTRHGWTVLGLGLAAVAREVHEHGKEPDIRRFGPHQLGTAKYFMHTGEGKRTANHAIVAAGAIASGSREEQRKIVERINSQDPDEMSPLGMLTSQILSSLVRRAPTTAS